MSRACAFCGGTLRADDWCASCEEHNPPETISNLTLDDLRVMYREDTIRRHGDGPFAEFFDVKPLGNGRWQVAA